MDYLKYDIKEGSTLESIAKEKGISVKELLDFHNSKASMTQQIYGDHIPLHVVSINIPSQKIAKVDFEFAKIEEGVSARYRCETSNVILVDGKPNFSAQVKTEYLCGLVEANDVKTFTIELKDYVNSINPSEMEPAFDLVKQIEAVRNIVVFSQTQNGKINKILNLQELSNKWQYFIKKEANSIPFFNELKARSPETIEDFIKNGYKEFSNSEELSTVLSKNLFYHILLEANSFEKSNFDIIQNSQLFPNILLKINVVKSMISEDEDFTTYRLVGWLVVLLKI